MSTNVIYLVPNVLIQDLEKVVLLYQLTKKSKIEIHYFFHKTLHFNRNQVCLLGVT